MVDPWTVVKVGGSLFDWPDLRARLHGWLAQLDETNVLLVPGGGATADLIRKLDEVHQLGEEAAHWLALRALSLNARFLQALLPEARILADIPGSAPARLSILDALPFFHTDERSPDHLPHHWHVTSDSLAVRVATLTGARELILLKSIDWSGDDWTEACRAGVVDAYFVQALQQAPSDLSVRVINLRASA